MGFWIFMLIMNLLIPTMMISFGWVFLNKTPKTINGTYGYRTAMSMKNQDTWDFAHKYAGALWFKWGKWILMISVVIMLLLFDRNEDMVGIVGGVLCLIQCVPMIYVIVPTERALKQNFDLKGKRREAQA